VIPLRVVLTGPESTGKTTLARELAAHYRAGFCPEFARDYLERKQRPLTAEDVEPIARGQRAAEDMAARSAGCGLLVLDTDLVSTVAYARHYYRACPPWIEQAARQRRAHLYLLSHPDVPWISDGWHRDQPESRDAVLRAFETALAEVEARRVDVAGGWTERRRRAVVAIDGLLQENGLQYL
jgi:NadR type nicotinamide-nucleotide adenylyltransferase